MTPSRERRPVQPAEAAEPGVVVGTCTGAFEDISKAGNRMITFVFSTPHGTVRHFCLRRSANLFETAQALGLGRSFRLSEASGRKCRLELKPDGPYWKVERTAPLQ